jgi:hypothetical protein
MMYRSGAIRAMYRDPGSAKAHRTDTRSVRAPVPLRCIGRRRLDAFAGHQKVWRLSSPVAGAATFIVLPRVRRCV